MSMNWYVVHTYAGFENKVRASIVETVSKLGLKEKIGQILVPTEEVLSIKGGKKRNHSESFSPDIYSSRWRWTIIPGILLRIRPR